MDPTSAPMSLPRMQHGRRPLGSGTSGISFGSRPAKNAVSSSSSCTGSFAVFHFCSQPAVSMTSASVAPTSARTAAKSMGPPRGGGMVTGAAGASRYIDSGRLLAGRLLHLLQDFVQVEGGRLLALRVLPERRQELADERLSRHEHECVIEDPIVVGIRGDVCPLVGIRPEVIELRKPQGHERLGPDTQRPWSALLHEDQLPVVVPQRSDLLVVVDVDERL